MKHLLGIKQLGEREVNELVEKAVEVKKKPRKYAHALDQKTLLMFFEMPSLRTMISFSVAMTEMGGSALYYNLKEFSVIGLKESIGDAAKVVSRYCDAVMARVYDQKTLEEFSSKAAVPVINGMTDVEHPCQILGDLLSIQEKKGRLRELKLAYVGDANNNTTHSLLYACPKMGVNISVACPQSKEFMPQQTVLREAVKWGGKNGVEVKVLENPFEACRQADVVYTDSWMSYRIPHEQEERRKKALALYRVNARLLRAAKKDAVFMHCLPAKRGQEVTDEVIDSKQSIVFDQAENRLHMQKAILLKLLK